MFNVFFASRSRGSWIPAVDIVEDADRFKVYVDLPDVAKADVHVETESNSVVCISGDRIRKLSDDDQRNLIVAERDYGRFERCFNLPANINERNVKASFANQVLYVDLPKLERSSAAGDASVTKGNSIKIDG